MGGRGSGAFVPRPALELPELVLGRPPLHVTVLQDALPHFQDDFVGAEEEEAEARGEHALQEKFGERWPARGLPGQHPGPGGCPAYRLGHEEVFLGAPRLTKAQGGQEAASVCPVCLALSLAAHLGPFLAPVGSLVSVHPHGACMA